MVSRWGTGKTRGTVLKVLCWQKLPPIQLSCCLSWPCLAALARAQHCPLLPGKDCQEHHCCISNGGSWKKSTLTSPKWLLERLSVSISIARSTCLGQQPDSGPALLTYPVCSTIALSLFSNWVLDPSKSSEWGYLLKLYPQLPTESHETEKNKHWDLTFIFISILFSLLFSN